MKADFFAALTSLTALLNDDDRDFSPAETISNETVAKALEETKDVIGTVEIRTQQVFVEFPNGYALSVVWHKHSYGGIEGAVFHGDKIVYDTPVTSDVEGWLNDETLPAMIRDVAALPERVHTDATRFWESRSKWDEVEDSELYDAGALQYSTGALKTANNEWRFPDGSTITVYEDQYAENPRLSM